jgi:LuxR family maltose regulon positive regulatory protein
MLDESGARIILLVAPAGYGKTTLAHEWLDSKQAAWYRGSPASADVAALAVGLATAASEVVPGAGEQMRQRLRASDSPEEDARILAEMLAEDLRNWPDDSWLVIDDYHFGMDAPACEEFVEVLLERANPCVVITSRRRPCWATARRRVYGSVLELDRTLLAMNAEEAQDLLSERTDASALICQAAGWPAVIGLAALTASQQSTRTELPTELYDYFAEELLHAVNAPQRTALCQLAFMPSITEPSARHLLGRHIATQALSEGLEGGLLQRGAQAQYEMHPLLRTYLQDRLRSLGANIPLTVAKVGVFLLMHREWDDALALAKQFRAAEFLDAFIESAWEPLLDEGRLATLASLIDLAAELRVRSSLVDLVESELAFRQGGYRKAETLAVESTRGLKDDHLLVRAYVRAGQSAHLEGRDNEAVAHHRRAQQVASTSADQREAVWGEFVCLTELENDNCAALLNRLERLGADDCRDSIRLANGKMLWAMRSGSGTEAELFAAIHSLSRVDDPLIRSSFLHGWASLLIYTGRYSEALDATHQQIRELKQNRLEFALPHTYINEALALRGLRRFREALGCLRRAERDRPVDDRVVITSSAVRIGIHLARGDLAKAVQIPKPSDPTSVAANVVAEFTANRALALGCAGQARAAISAAREACALSGASEPHVVSGLAVAVAALADAHRAGAAKTSINESLAAVSHTGHVDAFVTAYRGFPRLLKEAACRGALQSELAGILTRANDAVLARKLLPGFDTTTPAQRDPLSDREKEVLSLVAQGLRNQDIAQRLFISEVTVKAHMRNIMMKLGARSRTHAVSLAEISD